MKKRKKRKMPRLAMIDWDAGREFDRRLGDFAEMLEQMARMLAEMQADKQARSERARRANQTRKRSCPETWSEDDIVNIVSTDETTTQESDR